MNIIVTGTLAFDYIMNLPGRFRDYIMPDQLHILNVSFNANRMRKSQGGTGGNIAYTLALLNQNPILATTAGEDFQEYRKFLETHGVDCEAIKIIPSQLTSTGFCITDLDDNQIWSFSLNSSNHISKISLKPHLKPDSFVVISPSGPDGIRHFLKQCIARKCRFLFDPAFAIPALTPDELKQGIQKAEILIGNDYEINLIKQKTGLTDEQLLENNRLLVTTLGSQGSRIQAKTKNQTLNTLEIPPAKPIKVVDPAGAGDAYRAGFLAGYLNGLPLETAGRMGSLTGAYSVETYGTTTHHFTIEEFKKRYHKSFHTGLNYK
jgi:adenosine kinase